jgi:plastocyanin
MRKRLKLGAGALLVAGALLLAACGSSTPTKSGTAATSGASSGGTSITIKNFAFSPASLSVAPGVTITVTNKDSATHTVTASGGQFNTGDITQNQTKTFKAPTKPGNYPYICEIHQYMMGTLVVK